MIDLESLDFAKQGGLLPAIVQDARSHRVLMLGYMDRAALEATLAQGRVTSSAAARAGCG
jgi:phosphoribosyl-ATP pyrophosphohydrolase/phosphoribosyl-AMP cyclohydrolase